jgi:hypothetical protein
MVLSTQRQPRLSTGLEDCKSPGAPSVTPWLNVYQWDNILLVLYGFSAQEAMLDWWVENPLWWPHSTWCSIWEAIREMSNQRTTASFSSSGKNTVSGCS